MNSAKPIVAVLIAVAIGAAVYFSLQSETPLEAPTSNHPAPSKPAEPTRNVAAATGDAPLERVADANRGATVGGKTAPQGLEGQLLLPSGAPAAGIEIALVESAANDPLQAFLREQDGDIPAPLALGRTADDGTFRLGLHSAKQRFDFRSLSIDFPTLNRANLKVNAGEWYDIGQLRLKQGLVVTGRVVDSRTGAAVVGATVFLKDNSSAGARLAIPGREQGTPTTTDGNGTFRFANGPLRSSINLVAEADGYASTSLLQKQLLSDSPNNFTIELERGHTIVGVCVDQRGNRIANTRLTARALSAKTPQIAETIANADGEFEFPPLHEGPYTLQARSDRYADTTMPMALTGDDVKVVMATRGTVLLKVLSAKNRPIKSYRISLKRSFPNNPNNIGNVLGHKDRNISPRDYPREYGGEFARIQGLPAGTFRFQITDRDHAKTLSPIFEIKVGDDPVEVTANMTLGATITGTVIDDRGKPVQGAVIATDMNNGLGAGFDILEQLRVLVPNKHSTKQTRTDGQGRFRLNRLAFADYMLRASHPDFCEGVAIDITLEREGQTVDAGVIQLRQGAAVRGICTVGGAPQSQIEVRVSMPLNQMAANNEPGAKRSMPFRTKVLSDTDGTFKLLKRVPPGTYEISAARRSGATNPFDILRDLQETKRELVVAPGQTELVVDFDLTPR